LLCRLLLQQNGGHRALAGKTEANITGHDFRDFSRLPRSLSLSSPLLCVVIQLTRLIRLTAVVAAVPVLVGFAVGAAFCYISGTAVGSRGPAKRTTSHFSGWYVGGSTSAIGTSRRFERATYGSLLIAMFTLFVALKLILRHNVVPSLAGKKENGDDTSNTLLHHDGDGDGVNDDEDFNGDSEEDKDNIDIEVVEICKPEQQLFRRRR